jgi:putative redox protein
MLEVVVNHLGAVQFEAKARNHMVYCDQPVEQGGFDEGMTPPEFLLVAMGTCAGYYAVQYLKANQLPMEGLSIRTTAEKASAPARLSEIQVSVEYPMYLEARHREGMSQAVRKCLIHNTLLHPPQIGVEIHSAQATPVPMAA